MSINGADQLYTTNSYKLTSDLLHQLLVGIGGRVRKDRNGYDQHLLHIWTFHVFDIHTYIVYDQLDMADL